VRITTERRRENDNWSRAHLAVQLFQGGVKGQSKLDYSTSSIGEALDGIYDNEQAGAAALIEVAEALAERLPALRVS
jgi:hypothetical protein